MLPAASVTVVSLEVRVADQTISEDELATTAGLFAALAHIGRLRILIALSAGKPLSAGVLGELAGLKQTAASHQLRLLKEARLVTTHRQGRQILYTLSDKHVSHIILDAIAHVQEAS